MRDTCSSRQAASSSRQPRSMSIRVRLRSASARPYRRCSRSGSIRASMRLRSACTLSGSAPTEGGAGTGTGIGAGICTGICTGIGTGIGTSAPCSSTGSLSVGICLPAGMACRFAAGEVRCTGSSSVGTFPVRDGCSPGESGARNRPSRISSFSSTSPDSPVAAGPARASRRAGWAGGGGSSGVSAIASISLPLDARLPRHRVPVSRGRAKRADTRARNRSATGPAPAAGRPGRARRFRPAARSG